MRSFYIAIASSSLILTIAAPATAAIDMYTVIEGNVKYADTYDTEAEALTAANSWLSQGVNTLCSVDGGARELCDIVLSELPPDKVDHRSSGRLSALLDEQPTQAIAFYYALKGGDLA